MASNPDVIVLGAGAGGLAAACVAASEGLRTLLLEKTELAGGTTATSGGMIWIPANPKMKAAGFEDSVAAARTYLERCAPLSGGTELREAFLARGPEAIAYLEERTALRLRPVVSYPDYYPDLPGATLGGRVLEPVPFDARELGAHFDRLRWPIAEMMLFGGMMVERAELPHFRNVFRSARSAARVARLVAEYALQRLAAPRGTRLVLGNALVARLLKSALDLGVELRFGVAAKRLLMESGRVTGVETEAGKLSVIRGVVLATGGFSHDAQLRAQLLPPSASAVSPVCASNAGDGVRLGFAAGAKLGERNAQNAFWTPLSCFRREDGSQGVFAHTITDRGKPGIIAVNAAGERFASEALSYHEFALAMLRSPGAVPAFLLCDRKSLWQYGLGAVRPIALSLSRHKARGYLVEGRTIGELAANLRIDAAGLERTVARYNEDARRGMDTAFGIGNNVYQRFLGDRDQQPNPCMRPIETVPFYAIRLYPSDLGTAAGLLTNEQAQVLDGSGRPIAGLHACGNDMNSIFEGAYPGPGITLGPALTFGYIAARQLAATDAPG
ncbi:MAG: FAD-dependent oxidoreductase [Betaproteobacteria bacterium]|nr:MAG: FAD-dependent oxidoreductase [Betaproteobacteria bacterium]